MATFATVNPCTCTETATFTSHSADQLNDLTATAVCGAELLASLRFSERAKLFLKIAQRLRDESIRFARLMAVEMGKPVTQGEMEALKCARVCEHYAEHAESQLAPERVHEPDLQAQIYFDPLGTILAVMPWNFPLWQVFRCAAPVMMGGNAVMVKHAPNVPQCALAIAELFNEAGFPPNSFTNIFAETGDVEGLIANPFVSGVTLTGSTAAGKAVASLAGRYLKPCLMELGGSDPYIVFEDADVELAVSRCITSRLLNSGQSCIAAKRFLIHEAVADEFTSRLLQNLHDKTVGDPLDSTTDVGPLARPDLAEKVRRQVAQSLSSGARQLYRSPAPDGSCFVPIEVLGAVVPGMPAWDEELFGPVFALRTFTDDDEAIEMANDSIYGLGAGVFTNSAARTERLVHDLACGNIAVNDFVKSDPRYPFGGIKESGFGRELSHFGAKAFMNVKTVVTS